MGYEVLGIDFSPRMVEAARVAAKARGSTAVFVVGDLREHAEPEGSLAAVVFTYDVYSFIPTAAARRQTLEALRRSLGPEGRLFLSARRRSQAKDRAILTVQWLAGLFAGRAHRVGGFAHAMARRVRPLAEILRPRVHAPCPRGGASRGRLRSRRVGRRPRPLPGGGMTTRRWSSKGGAYYPSRQGTPPAMSFFDAARPPAGSARLSLALDRLGLILRDLPEPLAASLERRYGAYVDGALDPPRRISSSTSSKPRRATSSSPRGRPSSTRSGSPARGTRLRYCGYAVAGWFDTKTRRGAMVFGTGDREPMTHAVENYVRCAVAWCAAERGGALVHGASAVRAGKGYLFFGESGAGKSTLSEVSRRGAIVSDDLSLLLPRPGGGLDLVGSPFRGTYEGGDPVVGRFPLAAGFRILKAPVAAVLPAPRPVVFGQLVGNLTFVAEAFGERPDLFASVERAFAGVPLYHLEFRKDDTYWDAIDAAGL
jgi:hypothetical protein